MTQFREKAGTDVDKDMGWIEGGIPNTTGKGER